MTYHRVSLAAPMRAALPGTRAATTLARLCVADLPADVQCAEVTVAALFRASLILNYVTGGEAEMTFSARCFRSRHRARSGLSRGLWAATAVTIDAACITLRRERSHCATAWRNHRRRPRTRVS